VLIDLSRYLKTITHKKKRSELAKDAFLLDIVMKTRYDRRSVCIPFAYICRYLWLICWCNFPLLLWKVGSIEENDCTLSYELIRTKNCDC